MGVSTATEIAGRRAARGAASEFEAVYRANVAAVTGYFARRCSDPQSVADLTSETFVAAIGSFGSFDARRGSARAWLFGVARRVYADHCAAAAHGRDAASRLAAQLTLDDDEIEQLAARIDDQRAGRRLLERCARLPELDRAVIELVDVAGLSPTEAGAVLQVSPGALRVRLFRARARLRKGTHTP
jgi:RNA polymerase sigma factor (sigma-70 family)